MINIEQVVTDYIVKEEYLSLKKDLCKLVKKENVSEMSKELKNMDKDLEDYVWELSLYILQDDMFGRRNNFYVNPGKFEGIFARYVAYKIIQKYIGLNKSRDFVEA